METITLLLGEVQAGESTAVLPLLAAPATGGLCVRVLEVTLGDAGEVRFQTHQDLPVQVAPRMVFQEAGTQLGSGVPLLLPDQMGLDVKATLTAPASEGGVAVELRVAHYVASVPAKYIRGTAVIPPS